MSDAVRNLLGPPLKLRGPVTRADGGKSGVGRGYGGARVDLENLTITDPSSRLLLAAQLIWTLARADITGPYLISVDGTALDDRFVDGWKTTDVAATDPGAADGATAGVHALIGGSLVALDGQGSAKVQGSFGAMGDQRAAEATLLEAISQDDRISGLFVLMGDVMIRQGRKQEALGAFRRALELNPSDPSAGHHVQALSAALEPLAAD
jgi:tetratricopeptide (TPR) repeat protein